MPLIREGLGALGSYQNEGHVTRDSTGLEPEVQQRALSHSSYSFLRSDLSPSRSSLSFLRIPVQLFIAVSGSLRKRDCLGSWTIFDFQVYSPTLHQLNMSLDVVHHSQSTATELTHGGGLSLPFLSKSESAEQWLKYEQLFYSCLITGDDKSASLCLERLEQRFGASNDKVKGLRGVYNEAHVDGPKETEGLLKAYLNELDANPANIVGLIVAWNAELTCAANCQETNHAPQKSRQRCRGHFSTQQVPRGVSDRY